MKKVFLVDDEAVIRRSMAQNIDWGKEGYIYCGDASDGEMALPLIEKHQPDIVITDIMMPFMDGITLSKKIKEKYPHIEIIILSGHDEFSYAQEAINIRVANYCLKPVTPEDIISVLNKVREKLDSQSGKHMQHIVSKEAYLLKLCKGMMTKEEILGYATFLNIDILASYYAVVIIESDQQLYLLDSELQTIDKQRQLYIIKKDTEHILQDTLKEIRAIVINQDERNRIGIGSIETRPEQINVSYETAMEELHYSKVISKYEFMQELAEEQFMQVILKTDNRKNILDFVKYGSVEEIDGFIKSYLAMMTKDIGSHPLVNYYTLMDFTVTLYHYVKESEQYNQVVVDNMEIQKSMIKHTDDMRKVRRVMKEILWMIFSMKEKSQSKYGAMMDQVKHYIKENYHDANLSLHSIAQHVNISPSYLSNLFSQETGHTLTEYLTKQRVEHAKELLISSNLKTYEIAERVGYNDSHYFCNLFKRTTGQTTKEFKKNSKQFI
jgi:two-component system, response regulator YesN